MSPDVSQCLPVSPVDSQRLELTKFTPQLTSLVDVSVLYARQQKILSELAMIDERLGQIEREAATKVISYT